MPTQLKDWALLPYNSAKIRDKYILSTFLGAWTFVNEDEFKLINSLRIENDSALFRKLKKHQFILDVKTVETITKKYRHLHANIFRDTSLHIVVLTTRCNSRCVYCQAEASPSQASMSLKTATKILDFLFSSNSRSIRLEFQGGEPLLNWEALEFLVVQAQKQNKFEKKDLLISLVSNLTLFDKKKMSFLLKHGVEICTSLDGPERLHNLNRVFADGKGTYDVVSSWLNKINQAYHKSGSRSKVMALPTITRAILPHSVELIDEYVKWGYPAIHLRPLNKLGEAQRNWDAIGYSPEEFNKFWKESLDYILELNTKGIFIREIMASHILSKVLLGKDPLYVDLDSPCGAGRSQLAYAPNGDVYTCDEARMVGDEAFRLGNVLKDKYQDVMRSQNLFYTSQASLLNLWDYNSVFCNWAGTCPVMNYRQQGTPIVKITETPMYKIQNFQFGYIFDKLLYDKKAKDIFNKWIGANEEERK